MTRYDPFSYGQVKLGAGKEAPPADPDDLLFADAGPQKAPPADASWALLNEDVGSLLPGSPPEAYAAAAAQFADEVLGQGPAGRSASELESMEPPRPAPAKASAVRARAATAAPAATTTTSTAPRAPAKKAASVAARPVIVRRRGAMRSAMAWLLPITCFAGGGSVGAFVLIGQQNPILAGIIGLTAAVAGLFARIMLRD
ncbi:MAG: hypothetical protein JNN13_19060 [Planctomycetes bacterium]|nr:hypothetical protein [Planctomycetota bacterium]